MSGNTDRLAQLERYAANDEIEGVLPQTHRMLPVEDLRALVEIARAARVVNERSKTDLTEWYADDGDYTVDDFDYFIRLDAALSALDGSDT